MAKRHTNFMRATVWTPTMTMAEKQANYATHKDHLYRSSDAGVPRVICDAHGEVVLDLCKRCNRGEAELYDAPCEKPKGT